MLLVSCLSAVVGVRTAHVFVLCWGWGWLSQYVVTTSAAVTALLLPCHCFGTLHEYPTNKAVSPDCISCAHPNKESTPAEQPTRISSRSHTGPNRPPGGLTPSLLLGAQALQMHVQADAPSFAPWR